MPRYVRSFSKNIAANSTDVVEVDGDDYPGQLMSAVIDLGGNTGLKILQEMPKSNGDGTLTGWYAAVENTDSSAQQVTMYTISD